MKGLQVAFLNIKGRHIKNVNTGKKGKITNNNDVKDSKIFAGWLKFFTESVKKKPMEASVETVSHGREESIKTNSSSKRLLINKRGKNTEITRTVKVKETNQRGHKISRRVTTNMLGKTQTNKRLEQNKFVKLEMNENSQLIFKYLRDSEDKYKDAEHGIGYSNLINKENLNIIGSKNKKEESILKKTLLNKKYDEKYNDKLYKLKKTHKFFRKNSIIKKNAFEHNSSYDKTDYKFQNKNIVSESEENNETRSYEINIKLKDNKTDILKDIKQAFQPKKKLDSRYFKKLTEKLQILGKYEFSKDVKNKNILSKNKEITFFVNVKKEAKSGFNRNNLGNVTNGSDNTLLNYRLNRESNMVSEDKVEIDVSSKENSLKILLDKTDKKKIFMNIESFQNRNDIANSESVNFISSNWKASQKRNVAQNVKFLMEKISEISMSKVTSKKKSHGQFNYSEMKPKNDIFKIFEALHGKYEKKEDNIQYVKKLDYSEGEEDLTELFKTLKKIDVSKIENYSDSNFAENKMYLRDKEWRLSEDVSFKNKNNHVEKILWHIENISNTKSDSSLKVSDTLFFKNSGDNGAINHYLENVPFDKFSKADIGPNRTAFIVLNDDGIKGSIKVFTKGNEHVRVIFNLADALNVKIAAYLGDLKANLHSHGFKDIFLGLGHPCGNGDRGFSNNEKNETKGGKFSNVKMTSKLWKEPLGEISSLNNLSNLNTLA